MEYTEEQQAVIQETFNTPVVAVNALAGTGKTTTCFGVIEEAVKKGHKTLYLVFNKAMQLEAEERAKKLGLNGNVEIKTVHALAYKNIVRTGFFKGKAVSNIRVKDIADTFGTFDYDRAYFILKIFLEFLYSDYSIENIDKFLYELEQSSTFYEEAINRYSISAKDLVYLYDYIDSGQLPCPHDFYLKKFIDLLRDGKAYCKYDLVILDESQDANPCFASLLKHLRAKHLLMVGDRHQWIYAFRGSVNLMEEFENAKRLYLTHTFRFDDNIADLANRVLSVKGEKHLIKCKKSKPVKKERAIISRTNSELLRKYLSLSDMLKKLVVFERGIEEIVKLPLTIALILERKIPYLYCDRNNLQASKVIDEGFYKLFKNPVDLNLYVRELESLSKEGQASGTETDTVSAYKIADDYGTKNLTKLIHKYYASLEDDIDEESKLYMATAHSCKGQEYKKVTLLDDFRKFLTDKEYPMIENNLFALDKGFKEVLKERLRSNLPELNLLYVAFTRASDSIDYSSEVQKNLRIFDYCIKNGISIKQKKEKKGE